MRGRTRAEQRCAEQRRGRMEAHGAGSDLQTKQRFKGRNKLVGRAEGKLQSDVMLSANSRGCWKCSCLRWIDAS